MGFSITEIVQSKAYKAVMSKVYGIGAAVVIVGAMFKIQHWPGATQMLICGLTVEAIIFFLSAFEPPHEQPDWSLVYPELAGIHEEDLDALEEEEKKQKQTPKSGSKTALERFDEMLEGAELTPNLFEKFGTGLKTLNETTEKIKDVADVSLAANKYADSFGVASEKVSNMANQYSQSAVKLTSSAETLSNSYLSTSELISSATNQYAEVISKTAEVTSETVSTAMNQFMDGIGKATQASTKTIIQNGEQVASTYQNLNQMLLGEIENVKTGNTGYADQLNVLTKNMVELNSLYQLQMTETSEHLNNAKDAYNVMNSMISNLKESVADTVKYKDEVSKLSNNLSALNTVYGNMLNALNYNPQR